MAIHLDPWTDIVNVHWNDATHVAFALQIARFEETTDSIGSCSPALEPGPIPESTHWGGPFTTSVKYTYAISSGSAWQLSQSNKWTSAGYINQPNGLLVSGIPGSNTLTFDPFTVMVDYGVIAPVLRACYRFNPIESGFGAIKLPVQTELFFSSTTAILPQVLASIGDGQSHCYLDEFGGGTPATEIISVRTPAGAAANLLASAVVSYAGKSCTIIGAHTMQSPFTSFTAQSRNNTQGTVNCPVVAWVLAQINPS